jgi:hypothetical protein
MKSPFPGMDPYLEQRWSDVHLKLIALLELRRPLPKIPIPLRKKDREVPLDLQPLIDRVYTAGGHDDIDYNKPLNTPLTEQDAKWADELLRAAGRRK